MTGIALVAVALLATAEPAAATPAPQSAAHQQHQASGQHRADAASDARCCCEEMMHKMMTEMMQSHQGMDMSRPANAQTPPTPQEHKH